MSERQFLEQAAKQRAAATIRAVEAQTAAEVVITVRHAAARHFGTSVAFGAACGLLGLAVMWFSPQVYDTRTMPLDVALAALLGTLVCAFVPTLRRVLTPKQSRRRSAERAARAAFDTLGIAKTRGRTGLLVYVALFERTAVLLGDTGVPEVALRGPIPAVADRLARAVAALDFEAFLQGILELGPVCGAVLPRQADDENELSDEVV